MTNQERAVAVTVMLLVWLAPIVAVVGWSWTHRDGTLYRWSDDHPGWAWLATIAAFFGLGFLGLQAMAVIA